MYINKIGINIIKWVTPLLLAMSFSSPAFACPNYPCKPIRLVVPYETGGGIDSTARALAQVFRTRLKAEVVVMNKPGALGAIGTSSVASSPNDGYTLLVTAVNHVATAVLSERPLYDAIQDFAPIAKITDGPHILLVNGELPVNNAADLARLARQRPQGLTFANTGSATLLAAESFKQRSGGKWLPIPYKGSAQAMLSTITGETDVVFVGSQLALTALEGGRVKALAISSPKRVDYLPSVPTLRELGFDDVDSSQWYGILAPAGTPVAVIEILDKAIRQELVPDGILQKFIQTSRLETAYLGRPDFKVFLQEQAKRIKQLNIDVNN